MDINQQLDLVAKGFGDAWVEETKSIYFNFGSVPPGGTVFGFYNYDNSQPGLADFPIEAIYFTCGCWEKGQVLSSNPSRIIVELNLEQVGAPAKKEDATDGVFDVTRSFRIDFKDPNNQPDFLVDNKVKRWNNQKVSLWATLEGTIDYNLS